MTTRAKIAVGVGLVVCAVAWAVLRPEPAITASFVQYRYPDPARLVADLLVSNCTSVSVFVYVGNPGIYYGNPESTPSGAALLEPHASTNFSCYFFHTATPPQRVPIKGYRLSASRQEMRAVLSSLGIETDHPDFTVSIDLPPR